jgi:hypothetical protein
MIQTSNQLLLEQDDDEPVLQFNTCQFKVVVTSFFIDAIMDEKSIRFVNTIDDFKQQLKAFP